jgi:glycosyltransferase involved in cell wall biosynthesis
MLISKRCLGTVAYLGGTPAILEKFSWALLNLSLYNSEFLTQYDTYINYDRSKVSDHAKARNELVQSMRGDWILMLDADHNPDPDLLARMLNLFQKYKLEVLVGVYQVKLFPYPPLIYMWDDKHENFELVSSFKTEGDIFEIGASGGGCLLIRRTTIYRILNELKELPFSHTFQKNGKIPLSEDLSFFKRCYDLGIQPFCATNIENPHLEIAEITMEANRKAEELGMQSVVKEANAYRIQL